MAKYRMGRISEEMKKEISSIIMNDVKDPRLTAMVSVTDVETSPDLQLAKVFVSIFGTEEEKEETLSALKNSSGYIRHAVSQRIKLRHMPELLFKVDDTIDKGMHIDSILRKIKNENTDE